MGLKVALFALILGSFLVPGYYCGNFADIIRGLPDKFEESPSSRALSWPVLKHSTPRALLPFYMIAEHLLDTFSNGGLKTQFLSLQKSCSLSSLTVLIIPTLLAVIAAVAIIALLIPNIILTVLALVTNLLRLTGKQGIFRAGINEEYGNCNSQVLRLIKHDCAYRARDLNMVALADKEYYFSHSSIKLRWDEAQDFCRARCQQLVSIEDPFEESELFSHLKSMADESGEVEPFWTSGSYKNGKYKWLSTGRDFGHINLAPPRQRGRQVDSSCVGMATVRNETAWIGAPCEQMSRFVCEKPLQLAYRDHFLYEQMKREEDEKKQQEDELAAATTELTLEGNTIPIPSALETKFNEIRRRYG
ncbi:uncharacterized protein LOC135948642 [Cloeon dipterum]|uniref:uncharacterized protein LOC135948642 n=1 Tax=Cloeon dipterum TaxID=197152 RepID=UPI00321FA751